MRDAAEVAVPVEWDRIQISLAGIAPAWERVAESIKGTTESTCGLFARMSDRVAGSLSQIQGLVLDESLMRRLAAADQMLREVSEGPYPREEERLDRIIRSIQGAIPSAPPRRKGPGPKRTLTAAQIEIIYRYHAGQKGRSSWVRIAKKIGMSPNTLRVARKKEPISDKDYRKLVQFDFQEPFEQRRPIRVIS